MHQGIIIPWSARRQDLCSLHSEVRNLQPYSLIFTSLRTASSSLDVSWLSLFLCTWRRSTFDNFHAEFVAHKWVPIDPETERDITFFSQDSSSFCWCQLNILLSIWQQQIESIWPHSIPEGQEESVLELNRLDSHFFLVGILRSPVWISTMLIATNQISECLHNLGVSSWHFATTVTYIMKTHIMEVMNFCLHNRNLFGEMLRRYW